MTGDVHWCTPDGTVACNPRDREAAHRAGQGKLAVAEPSSLPDGITCRSAGTCTTGICHEVAVRS